LFAFLEVMVFFSMSLSLSTFLFRVEPIVDDDRSLVGGFL